ncbi:MAG: hypothetical protein V4574_15705 [Pseudomonadota bacterium]
MKRFASILVAGLSLLVLMLKMYLGRVGILMGSKQERLVLQEGDLAVPYDGKTRPHQSAPFPVIVCSYWEGFRVSKVLVTEAPLRCPLVHGLA